jgi:haloalkane dehalogenase
MGANPTVRIQYAEVEGLRLHYLEAGPPKGLEPPPDPEEAVLLIHGFPTSSHLWRNVMPHIARTRRVIAIDLPGFGNSAKPLDASYSFNFHDRTLEAFLAKLRITKVNLVVHDLGGPIGMYWAVNHPEKVLRLALLNTLVYPEFSWAVKAFGLAIRMPVLKYWLTGPAGIAFSMRFGVERKQQLTPEVLSPYQTPFESREARDAMLKAGQRLGMKGFRQIGAKLKNFKVPVRLIYGENDRILPDVAETMQRVKQDLPQAELSSLPNCGHFLQEDEPEKLGELLAEFFDRPIET